MGKLADKYQEKIADVLAEAAREAQKPLGPLYLKVYPGYIGPNNIALELNYNPEKQNDIDVSAIEKFFETNLSLYSDKPVDVLKKLEVGGRVTLAEIAHDDIDIGWLEQIVNSVSSLSTRSRDSTFTFPMKPTKTQKKKLDKLDALKIKF